MATALREIFLLSTGSLREWVLHSEKYFYAVWLEWVFAVLAIAAAEGQRCIGEAYLGAGVTQERSSWNSDSWADRFQMGWYPELQTLVGENEKLHALLDEALHGCG